MERDSVQEILPGDIRPAARPGRWSLLLGLLIIVLVAAAGWTYSQTQNNQALTAFNAGNTYAAQGDTTQAITSYDQAIKLKPDYSEAYYRRGLLYAEREHPDIAIADFTLAIQYQSGFADAYYHRALAYQQTGQKAQAASDLRDVLRLSQDSALRQQATAALTALAAP